MKKENISKCSSVVKHARQHSHILWFNVKVWRWACGSESGMSVLLFKCFISPLWPSYGKVGAISNIFKLISLHNSSSHLSFFYCQYIMIFFLQTLYNWIPLVSVHLFIRIFIILFPLHESTFTTFTSNTIANLILCCKNFPRNCLSYISCSCHSFLGHFPSLPAT